MVPLSVIVPWFTVKWFHCQPCSIIHCKMVLLSVIVSLFTVRCRHSHSVAITQLSWVDVPTSLPVQVQKVDFQIQIVKPPLPTPPPPPLPILERVPHTGSQEVFTSKTQLTDLDSTDTRDKD